MTATSLGGHSQVGRAIAGYGLAGVMIDLPAEPLADDEFGRLLVEVRMQRLSGLLWRAVADGALPVTARQAEQAEWLHVKALAAALVLERLLIQTVGALTAVGVDVRVLKGTAVGHLDYPDPSLRTFGDIDLLVRGEHFDVAVETLVRQGHDRRNPQPRPGFDRRFSKGTSFRTGDGLEIDLHRTFTMGPLGLRLDLARLWARHEEFTLGGQSVPALAREERFLHACYHAALGEQRPRLAPLRDVAQLALDLRLDLARVHELIRASRGQAVVARAVRAAWSELDLADVLAISAWAHTYRSSPAEAAELATYGPGSTYARKSVAALRALPTLTERAAYLYALLNPTRAYIGTRHHGRLDRLRTGLRQGVGHGGTT